jgi:hypothetical protein
MIMIILTHLTAIVYAEEWSCFSVIYEEFYIPPIS